MNKQNFIGQFAGCPNVRWVPAARLWLSIALALALAGCATAPMQKKDGLEMRSQARWDALIGGNYEEAWALYSPGHRSSQSVVDLEISWRMRRVQIISAVYDSHSCDEYLCQVGIMLTYKIDRPVTGLEVWENTKVFEEKWIFAEDQWWYLPE